VQGFEFVEIYTILNESYFSTLWPALLWSIPVIFFASLFFVDAVKNFSLEGPMHILKVTAPPIFVFFALFIDYDAVATQYRAIRAAQTRDYFVVEGRIGDLHTHQKYESFVLNGMQFSYFEYSAASGYKQSKGRKLNNDMPVRISHKDGCILKMAIGKEIQDQNSKPLLNLPYAAKTEIVPVR